MNKKSKYKRQEVLPNTAEFLVAYDRLGKSSKVMRYSGLDLV